MPKELKRQGQSKGAHPYTRPTKKTTKKIKKKTTKKKMVFVGSEGDIRDCEVGPVIGWATVNGNFDGDFIPFEENKMQEDPRLIEKAKETIRQKKIFLCYTTGSVPCVGLDNGFTTQRLVGPVDKLEFFTEKEKQKLIAKGVPEDCMGKYKSVGGHKFNWRAAKKYHVTVYGGSLNNERSWGALRENYDGVAGNVTHYTNYKGEKWTENY